VRRMKVTAAQESKTWLRINTQPSAVKMNECGPKDVKEESHKLARKFEFGAFRNFGRAETLRKGDEKNAPESMRRGSICACIWSV
jgi:hypothetical protein